MNNHIVGGIIFVVTWRVIGFKSAVVVTAAYYYGGGINGTGTGININGTDVDLFNRPSVDSSSVEGDIVVDNDDNHTTDDAAIDVKSDDASDDVSIENHVDEYEIDDRYIADKEIEGSVEDNDDSELEDFTGSDLDVPSEVPSDVASTTFEDLFIPTEQTAYSDALSDTTVDFDNIRESDYGRTNDGTISEYDGPDFGDDPESTDDVASNVSSDKPDVLDQPDVPETAEERAERIKNSLFMRGKSPIFISRLITETSYTVADIDTVSLEEVANFFAVRDGLSMGDSIYNDIENEASNFKQFFYNVYDFFSSFFDDASTKATKEMVKTVVSNESTINLDLQKLSTEVHVVESPELLGDVNIPAELEKIEASKNISDKIAVEYFLGYDSGTGRCISDQIPDLLSKSTNAFVKLHESHCSGVLKGLTYENGNSLIHEALNNTFKNLYRYESYKDIVKRDYKEIANLKETFDICHKQLIYPITFAQEMINDKLIRNEIAPLLKAVMDSNVVVNSDQSLTLKCLKDSSDTLADIVVRKLEKSEGAMKQLEWVEQVYDKSVSSRVLKRAAYHAVLRDEYSGRTVSRAFNDIMNSGIDTNMFKNLGEARFDGFEEFKAIK